MIYLIKKKKIHENYQCERFYDYNKTKLVTEKVIINLQEKKTFYYKTRKYRF